MRSMLRSLAIPGLLLAITVPALTAQQAPAKPKQLEPIGQFGREQEAAEANWEVQRIRPLTEP